MAPPPSLQLDLEGTSDVSGATFLDSEPLTLDNVDRIRRKVGLVHGGVAAKADIEQLKGRWRNQKKPLAAKDWSDKITAESKHRQPSAIKDSAQFLKWEGMLSLGGGLPSSDYFPFGSYSIKAPTLGHFSEEDTERSGVFLSSGKHDMQDQKSFFDIATAFNYGQGCGSVQLLRFLIEHTEIVHNPPYKNWQCTMTIGNTSGLDMCLRMLTRPNMYILSEEYTFSTATETALAMGVKIQNIATDEQGLLPNSLDYTLTIWDPADHSGADKPFILYTVPSGQNPTGATQSGSRRRALYAVAQKHDLLIIEDEPYYFLQMEPYAGALASSPPAPKTAAEFLSALVPSYLSLDTDGRVLRLDSFSKVIAPNARVGWLTGSAQLVDRYRNHSDLSTQSPSGFSQLALFKLLDEHWGHAGYLQWLMFIRVEYTRRRNAILDACERFLPREVVSWRPPMAGMFHWLEVEWKKHPRARDLGFLDLEDGIWKKGIEKRALLIKGSLFKADFGWGKDKGEEERMFFRATYAAAPEGMIKEAVRRFGEALREEFGLSQINGAALNGEAANGH